MAIEDAAKSAMAAVEAEEDMEAKGLEKIWAAKIPRRVHQKLDASRLVMAGVAAPLALSAGTDSSGTMDYVLLYDAARILDGPIFNAGSKKCNDPATKETGGRSRGNGGGNGGNGNGGGGCSANGNGGSGGENQRR